MLERARPSPYLRHRRLRPRECDPAAPVIGSSGRAGPGRRCEGEHGMELGLKGRAALVTGASEGIGMALARKLADEGVGVAICARTEAKLHDTAAEIAQATGMQIVPIAVDLRTLA